MESSSSSSSIEMKVISCKDLKAFNFFQKLSVYAVVSITSDDPSKKVQQNEIQLQRTPTDTHGDGNPEWNHEVRFDLKSNCCGHAEHHLFLHFNLRHEGIVFGLGDRTIGEVRIPLKDLMEEASSNGVVRFVSYQVRSSDCKPNGVLNLSYKLIGCGTANNPNPNPYPNPNPKPNPNPNYAAGRTVSASGFPSSNTNRIQYPTVEAEPVSIPLPLMTTRMVDHKPQECYWPTQPQSQPLDFRCHSYPLFQGHGDEAYYHSLPPPPPPSYGYGYGERGADGILKDGDQIKGNVYLWN